MIAGVFGFVCALFFMGSAYLLVGLLWLIGNSLMKGKLDVR